MQWSNETYKGRKATYQFSKDGDFKLPPKPVLVMVNLPLVIPRQQLPNPLFRLLPFGWHFKGLFSCHFSHLAWVHLHQNVADVLGEWLQLTGVEKLPSIRFRWNTTRSLRADAEKHQFISFGNYCHFCPGSESSAWWLEWQRWKRRLELKNEEIAPASGSLPCPPPLHFALISGLAGAVATTNLPGQEMEQKFVFGSNSLNTKSPTK